MSSSSLLVTGAGGFVGKNLIAYLSKSHRFDITALVRRETHELNSVRTLVCENLELGFEWPNIQIDTVIHLAGKAHSTDAGTGVSIDLFRAVNTHATIKLAKQAAAAGVRRFIFLSSIGVYGRASSVPLSSIIVPCPIEPYSVSKYEAELLLIELSKQTGMDVVIIRPPLVYGPGAPGNFSRLIKLSCIGIPLPFGQVLNRRSFIGVDNLCSVIELCIFHPKATQIPILPADIEVVSTVDAMKCISEACNVKLRLIPIPVRILQLMFKLIGKHPTYCKIFNDLEILSQETYDLLDWTPPNTFASGIYDAVISLEKV